ncbi:MAG: hypothetical protein MK138_18415 [Planctomycetes bacterium]|nr:hypothetical protein [Planctomycetota bacterium]
MPSRKLTFLGSSASDSGEILVEDEAFLPGGVVALKRRRSPWDPSRPVERIILGSNPARADVLVKAVGIEAEHVRFYLPVDGCGDNDLKVIVDGTVKGNGRNIPPTEWIALVDGDELELSSWLFKFEQEG